MDEVEVFSVGFICRNCGAEWDETYPARVRVLDDEYQKCMAQRNVDCTEVGYQQCDCCELVTCPNCELRKPVEAERREPVAEEVAAQ